MKTVPKRKHLRLLIPAAVILIILLTGVVYVNDNYDADPAAETLLAAPPEGISVTREKQRIIFAPETVECGLIFYPGAKVEAAAYAPLMTALAEKNILCVLIEMPLMLAFLDMNAADQVYDSFPEVNRWILAGHSLGGASASLYAAKHPEKLSGLVLLASYSTAGLSTSGLKVLSVYGSEDEVLNPEKYAKFRSNLPEDLTEVIIPGGNHAGFGYYGIQKKDGTGLISAEEQIQITAEEIYRFMAE